MANRYSVQSSSTPIGTIIKAVGPPDNTWLKCNGDILEQASYSAYVAKCDNLHPAMWKNWSMVDVDQSVTSGERYAISRNGDRIVVVGSGNVVWVSTDKGLTWSTNTNLTTGLHYCLSNNGTRFITAKHSSNEGYYSSDGVTWTKVNLPRSTTWRMSSYFSNKFVLMPSGLQAGTQKYAFSSDGVTWAEHALPFSDGIVGAVSNDGTQFLMWAYNYDTPFSKLYKSTNGTTWTAGTVDFLDGAPDSGGNCIINLYYVNSQWIASWDEYFIFSIFEGSNILNPLDWKRYRLHSSLENDNYTYIYDLPQIIWTGEHYLIPNPYVGSLCVGKSLTNLTYFPSNAIGSYGLMVNDGDNYVVSVPFNLKSIARSTGVTYNKATHFQLPSISVNDNARIYHYIKISE